jgi:plastocyanin domain-containing protein
VSISYHIRFSPYNSGHLTFAIEAAFLTGMTIVESAVSLGIEVQIKMLHSHTLLTHWNVEDNENFIRPN